MNCPIALAELNRVLHHRRELGLSAEIVDIEPQILRDDVVGLFLRLDVLLADDTRFHVDTIECRAMLESAEQAARVH